MHSNLRNEMYKWNMLKNKYVYDRGNPPPPKKKE